MGQTSREGEKDIWWTARTARGGTGHLGLTPKRHIPPHPAQPQHTNHWAPRTRKRHQQEHRPQRPTERSDPTQHAKGRPGDCPGPRKGTTTRRHVTQGGGGGGGLDRPPHPPTKRCPGGGGGCCHKDFVQNTMGHCTVGAVDDVCSTEVAPRPRFFSSGFERVAPPACDLAGRGLCVVAPKSCGGPVAEGVATGPLSLQL